MSLRGPFPRYCSGQHIVSLDEMLQRWRAVGNTVSDLTGPRFKPQTCSRDECVTARPTGRSASINSQIFVNNRSFLIVLRAFGLKATSSEA